MRLIIIGNTSNGDIAEALLQCKDIEIIAGVADEYSKETQTFQKHFLQKHKIPQITFNEIASFKPDICLSIAYFTIIDIKYFRDILALNIHAGVLPVWKGFNANAWAIINGEDRIGYSLHALTDKMDGGDVYYQWIENVGKSERYAQIVNRIKKRAINEIANVLLDINNGKIKPVQQDTSIEFYCKKIGANENLIKTWNLKAQELYNRFRVVAMPYGKGLFFKYKGKKYEIIEMQPPSHINVTYICTLGAIINIYQNCMWVKVSDMYVKITKIHLEGNEVELNKEFKIGNVLEP